MKRKTILYQNFKQVVNANGGWILKIILCTCQSNSQFLLIKKNKNCSFENLYKYDYRFESRLAQKLSSISKELNTSNNP